MEFMESGIIMVWEKTIFRWRGIEICPEASSSWAAGLVEGFGQVFRAVITSCYLGLYTWTGNKLWQTDLSTDRRVPCPPQWKTAASCLVLEPGMCPLSDCTALSKDCSWGRNANCVWVHCGWDRDSKYSHCSSCSSSGNKRWTRSVMGPCHQLVREEEE